MTTTWIPLPRLDVEISTTAVLAQEFLPYQAAMQTPPLAQRVNLSQPVVGISASEASRYAQWIGQQNGHLYRLPLLSEMQALVEEAKQGEAIWSYQPDAWDKAKITHLFEWLDGAPEAASPIANLRCITHPWWLQPPNRQAVKAAIADGALPYVTFRLVRLR